jgi:uncharacterized protein (TIGR04222 family)
VTNPLDLTGPNFLVFYLILGLAGLAWLVFSRRRDENAGVHPKVELSDPYLIAYLRGGTNEAARVASVSLIERGLLVVEDDATLHTKLHVQGLQPRIEQEIVDLFRTPKPATDLFTDPAVHEVCEPYDQDLKRLGLLPDAATIAARRRRLIPVLAILLALAVAKIYVGLTRHRPIGLLLVVTIVFILLSLNLYNPRHTGRGSALIEDLRRLFSRLKERAGTLRPGAYPSETALLVAVFGLGALPKEKFPWARQVFPKASRGSSTGSGCGSGCGSACGGGGCGGGCGGCGGGGD